MSNQSTYLPKRARRTTRLYVRGIDYRISEWGSDSDPLLVYLHGWGDCGTTIQFVVDALQKDWFVVAPDWRGFGESTSEAVAFWFPDYLADLDDLLLHYSPGMSVRLIGHSMGANVAGLYAGTMPDRVASLVNIEGFGLPDAQPADAPGRYRAWIKAGHEGPAFAIRESFADLAATIRRRSQRMTPAQAEFVAREWAREDADGRVRLRANPAHKLPNPVLYRRPEAEACWRNVSAEVLLVTGRQSEFAARVRMPFPRQSTVSIDDAGHMLHFEQPEALARVIEEFLEKPNT